VPLKRGTAHDTFPSKIYTILAAGRPVIVSADLDSELAWIVEQTDCGWTTLPDDAAALAQAVEWAHRERSTLPKKGMNGRAYVMAHHSRRAATQKYHELIQQIAYGI
jgi:colanic acid biosynthesis glycosyl transferase WcaI